MGKPRELQFRGLGSVTDLIGKCREQQGGELAFYGERRGLAGVPMEAFRLLGPFLLAGLWGWLRVPRAVPPA